MAVPSIDAAAMDRIGCDVIMTGNWDGDGDDTVAVYRPSAGRIYVNLANRSGAATYTLFVGTYPNAVTWGR